MARIRSVHPGLWTDEQFVCVGDKAKLLFIGLWGEADDRGIFEWKPTSIKMRLRAWDGADVVAMLTELAGENMIRQFDHAGKKYGAIRRFCKWQRPKSPAYVHPCPDEIAAFVDFAPDDSSPDRGTALGKMLCERQSGLCHYCGESITFYRKKINSLEIDHRIPISRGGDDDVANLVAACKPCNSLKRDMTDVEFVTKFAIRELAANRESQFAKGRNSHATEPPLPLIGEKSPQMEDGGWRGEEDGKKESATRKPRGGLTAQQLEEFETWWQHYPKRVARKEAERAFLKARKTATLEQLIAGVKRYAASITDPKFTANPATWLNQGRWLDEYPGIVNGPDLPKHRGPTGPPPAPPDGWLEPGEGIH